MRPWGLNKAEENKSRKGAKAQRVEFTVCSVPLRLCVIIFPLMASGQVYDPFSLS
jgi:hypothetical protein